MDGHSAKEETTQHSLLASSTAATEFKALLASKSHQIRFFWGRLAPHTRGTVTADRPVRAAKKFNKRWRRRPEAATRVHLPLYLTTLRPTTIKAATKKVSGTTDNGRRRYQGSRRGELSADKARNHARVLSSFPCLRLCIVYTCSRYPIQVLL